MATPVESYCARINELHKVQDYISERIRVLEEEAGIAPDFEAKFDAVIEDLSDLLNDRRENDDTHTLWEIYYELSAITHAILKTISGYE